LITDITMKTGSTETSAIALGMTEEQSNSPLRYEYKKAVQQVHACRLLKDKAAAEEGEKAAREVLKKSIAKYAMKLTERAPQPPKPEPEAPKEDAKPE
jgi:hypothetical protein